MLDLSVPHIVPLIIENLSCGGCAARAEKALNELPFVATAQVNLATKTAQVTVSPDFAFHTMEAAMRKAGYPVAINPQQTRALRFGVENLSCGGCAARAEKALNAYPAVVEAKVNLATKEAFVTTLRDVSVTDLAATMRTAGYPIVEHESDGAAGTALGDDATVSTQLRDEQTTLKRQVILAALLTLPVFVMEMGGHILPAFHHWQVATFGHFTLHLVQFILTTIVLFGPGAVFFRLGVPALLRAAPEMNALVALGTMAAWAFSTVVTFAPALIPEASRFVYFEAAAVIVTLILLGRFLETRARGQAGAAIRGLMELRPDTATVLRDGTQQQISAADLRIGDLVRVKPGEKVAIDGIVVEGTALVDESMITGEAVPVAKAAGDTVVGGTLNRDGSAVFRVTATGGQTVLAQIVDMVAKAQMTRLPIQSLINRVAAVFVPVVMGLAVLTTALWWVFGPSPVQAMVIGVSVLIIACPCAMGLATPVSVMAGTGRAAQLGVHFREGHALQSLRKMDLVAFDKTGTLTTGLPSFIGSFNTCDEDQLIALAAAVERGSEHPFAQAIMDEATGRGLLIPQMEGFENTIGAGVRARVEGVEIALGTEGYLAERGVTVPNIPRDGASVIHMAKDGAYLGSLAFRDASKRDAKATIAALGAQGVKVAILSGDEASAVDALADELGVRDRFSQLQPADKLQRVKDWQEQGMRVAFVGDGINDAPVLAQADIGIALGSGTDIAMEAADVVLVSGAPSGVVSAMALSRATMRNIAQNLFWAFGYNVALIPVAAGALALFGGPLLNPMLAAGAMAASSVFVVMNALRLRHVGGGL
ncbi:heavy metal translocating P-type ATPase [Rhodobacteraceae bacterium XHP0102]|nr:heavy metal translocating P-type ATPase [Rhodobacteraceae bacterium XHP0102]